jgi:predicted MFS family arabinose efflux permease
LNQEGVEKFSVNRQVLYASLMGFNFGVTFMNVPPALDRLMKVYQVSYVQASVLIGMLFWCHALMQIPGGMVADRLGIRKTLLIGLICICLGNLLPAVHPSLELALLGRTITGVGTGLSFLTSMKMIALYAPPGRVGVYQSFIGGLFAFGTIFSYLVIPVLAGASWRWAYLVPGAIGLIFLAFLGTLRPESTPQSPPRPLALGRILRIRNGWILGIYHALSFGSVVTLSSWWPSLLSEIRQNPTAAQVAWGGASLMLISGVGRVTGGFLLLRLKSSFVANTSILILSVLFLGLFLIPYPGLTLALLLLAAWFGSINFGAFFHLAAQETTPDSLATLLGFINFLANAGAVLFTLMFGWIKQTSGVFAWGFVVLSLIGITTLMAGWNSFAGKTEISPE